MLPVRSDGSAVRRDRALLRYQPISFAAPTADERTVVSTWLPRSRHGARVLDKRSRHESIPDTWAVDAKGRPVTDSRLVNALVPIEGAKGYGLMMMVDIFSGVLLGVPFGKHVSSMYHDLSAGRELGQMFIVMDPSRFVGLDAFKASMSQVLDELGEMRPQKALIRCIIRVSAQS